jgi:hypothetical protein
MYSIINMKCSFCEKDINQSSAIKYNAKNHYNISDVNIGSIRCAKCKTIFSCKNCETDMKKHYESCIYQQQPICHIYTTDCDPLEYNYIHIPIEIGGGIADIKSVVYHKDGKLIIFHECKYVLIDNNGKVFWAKYDPCMEEIQKKQSIGEQLCMTIIKELYPNNKFIKMRPDWLKNPNTGWNMELNIYCDELKIAIEYNGKQHYEYVEYFHRNEINFNKQRERDVLKNELCEKNDIKLITVPHTCNTYEKIKECISNNIK